MSSLTMLSEAENRGHKPRLPPLSCSNVMLDIKFGIYHVLCDKGKHREDAQTLSGKFPIRIWDYEYVGNIYMYNDDDENTNIASHVACAGMEARAY